MQLPQVAVCMAAYQGLPYLPEQVASIAAQTDVVVDLFVSVDRSTDGTLDWLSALAARDPRVHVLPYGERFGGAAANFFRLLREIDFSRFDFVALADQDDIWMPGKLARAVAKMVANGAQAYSSDVIATWDSGASRYIRKSQPQTQWDFLFEAAGPGCTYVMRSAFVGALQASLRQQGARLGAVGLHDWYIYAFARAHGYRWHIDDYAGMYYRQHAHNQVGVNAGWRAWLQRVRTLLGGWGLTQAVLIADLVGLKEHPFVVRWSQGGRLGLLWLAFQARRCRRRRRDQWFFFAFCLVGSVMGRRGA